MDLDVPDCDRARGAQRSPNQLPNVFLLATFRTKVVSKRTIILLPITESYKRIKCDTLLPTG